MLPAPPRSRGGSPISFLLALLAAQVLGILASDAGWLASVPALRGAAVCAALALAARRGGAARALAAGALGLTAAYGLAIRLEEAARAPRTPREVTIEASVSSLHPLGDGVEVELHGVQGRGPSGGMLPSRLLLRARPRGWDGALPLADARPGDRLRARVHVRALDGRANPGGRDRVREAARRGIGASASLVHPDLVVRRPDAEGLHPFTPWQRLRARARARLAQASPGGALVRALALGDRDALDADARAGFRRLGLSHLLAVSGLHLALVAAVLYRLAGAAVRRLPSGLHGADPRQGALAATALGSLGYALLAGWGLPLRRALVMLVALVASAGLRRPVARAAPLAAAAILLLAADPAALFDPGAQMSFAATAALMAAARAPARGETGLRSRVAELVDATAVAGTATLPLAAVDFGTLSACGVAANVVAVPWTGLVLVPACLVAALLAGLAPGAAITGWVVRVAAALGSASLAAVVAAAARVPDLRVATPAPAALAAAALGAWVVVRTRRRALRVALAVVLPLGLAGAPPWPIEPPPPRVVVLDVGQGDAIVVQGRGGALLVDGGTALPGGPDLGETVVVPALRALGVRRLDLVVATHADLDHRGGLGAVLRTLPVTRLWLPFGGARDPDFAPLLAAARGAGIPVEERGTGSAPELLGDLRVAPLWPPREPNPADPTRNDRSLTLRVEAAGRAVLLPGDLEAPAEARLVAASAPLAADVLKLPHHGSRTSSSAPFLAAVGGSVAIASAPRSGRFGMPHPDVVARARAAGYTVRWTGRDGAVLVGLGPRLPVRGWRETPLPGPDRAPAPAQDRALGHEPRGAAMR
jgi:competence protein ComEC